MTTKIYPLPSKPGIRRDGTVFDGSNWVDGQWVRFQRGRPRKMGGHRQVSDAFSGPVRGCYVYPANGYYSVCAGYSAGIECLSVDADGYGSGIIDRTPVGFSSSANNVWQFDAMYDAAGGATRLVAHGAPNLLAIDSTTARPVYVGTISAATALTSTGQSVSGGACVLHPHLFVYGDNGYVGWSDINSTTNFTTGQAGNANITATKIVKGTAARGGPGNSPSGLFWSLDSVIRSSYVGGSAVFRFDTLTDESSILSSSGVVEYDGMFFWPGVDRFLFYNGVVKEVPNDMNLNYFFDNVNMTYRQKVWGLKIPRFGEIWWFYPSGNNTECDRAVCYNVREGSWYDTSWARSAGYFSQVFRYPLAFGTEATSGGKYRLWQQEFGVDEQINTQANAIESYCETSDIAWCANGVGDQWMGEERWVELYRVEPDLVQTGDMTLTVKGNKYAREALDETTYTFGPTDGKIDCKEQRRQMRLRFTSNVAGGDYQMGQTIMTLGVGDGR